MPRCVPGAHLVRKGFVHPKQITSFYYGAYKYCCMRKGNRRDEVELNQWVRCCTSCWTIIHNQAHNPTEPEFSPDRKNLFEFRVPRINEGECFLCQQGDPSFIVPFDCKIDFFIKTGLVIAEEAKCCRKHISFDQKGFELDVHFLEVRSQHGIVALTADETTRWFSALRTSSSRMDRAATLNRIMALEDEDFRQVLGIRREQFQNLSSIACGYKIHRLVCRPLSIVLLLMKLRNCQYLSFLKALFGFKSRGAVSSQIKIARLAIKHRFVPDHLGAAANPRPECLRHVTQLAKKLHLSEDNNENAVLVVDSTYIYIPKSGNFTVLRRSYSQHKGRHLLKMSQFVFPDGRIFDSHGPYFCDSKNNDSAILKHELASDLSGIKNWLIPGDVLVVDRGYRDVVPFLSSLGISVAIPRCRPARAGQLSTQQANASRLVTKTRWVVEMRQGHIQQIFKYLGRSIHAGSVPMVRDYFKICCALINAYYPELQLSERSQAVGQRMLEMLNSTNTLLEELRSRDLLNPRVRRVWRDMFDEELEEFPRLSPDDFYELTMGVFQIRLAPSYIGAQEEYFFQVPAESGSEEQGLLRVKVWSRHSSSTFYYVFVQFRLNQNGHAGIIAWYCTCKSGARTIGMCAHIFAIIWYLGNARYEPNIPAPSAQILETTLDAAERHGRLNIVSDDEVGLLPVVEINALEVVQPDDSVELDMEMEAVDIIAE